MGLVERVKREAATTRCISIIIDVFVVMQAARARAPALAILSQSVWLGSVLGGRYSQARRACHGRVVLGG